MNKSKATHKWIAVVMTVIITVMTVCPQNSSVLQVQAEENVNLAVGSTYNIISKENNKVIEVSNFGVFNGDELQQWEYSNEESQQWKVEKEGEYYKFVNENSKKVLSTEENAMNGAVLFQWDDMNADTQLWYLEQCEEEYVQIKSKANDKCIDITGISKDNGAKLQVWDDVDGNNQKWKFVELEVGNKIVSGAKYKITSKTSKKSLEVGYNSQEDGGTVQQWQYEQGSNQQWFIEKVEEKYYKIIADHSGKALTVKDAGTDNGTLVEQKEFNGSNNQLWYLSEDPDGYYRIRSKQSEKALDVKDISQENGALIQIWENDDGDNQKWSLEMISYDAYPTIYLYVYDAGENEQMKAGWESTEDITEFALYGRYDEETEFKKISEAFSEDSISQEDVIKYEKAISSEKIAERADFRVVGKTKYGKEILSPVVSVKKTDIGIEYAVFDTDQDGLEDGYEIWDLSTDYKQNDTDGDGFWDGYEVLILCTNPLEVTEDADYDGDGLSNLEEMQRNTNPYVIDTDFDGRNDKEDGNPLSADEGIVENLSYDLSIPTGFYDKKLCGYDEDGKYFEYIYNTLLEVYRYGQQGEEEKVYNFYDVEGKMYGNVVLSGEINEINSYGYDDNKNITNVSHNGFGYDFTYDENNNLTGAKVGEQQLISVVYDNETNAETEIVYGNGDKKEYVYDEDEKLAEIKIDEAIACEYVYDENYNVIEEKDCESGITYHYEYDETGEVIAFNTSHEFAASCIWDENGNRISGSYYLGDEEKTYIYTEEEEQCLSDFGQFGKFVSLKEEEAQQVITETYNGQEQLILQQKTYALDENVIETDTNDGNKFQYQYDENGNICVIYQNGEEIASYEYDLCNQLIRENNVKSGITKIYSYDDGGNIIQEQQYPYTKENVASNGILNNVLYSYTNETWKDLLTEYNGQVITQDELGNPLQYVDGKSFTWKDGRKLATYCDGTNRAEYFYDSSNQRVKKIVNGTEVLYNWDEEKLISQKDENGYLYFLYDSENTLVGFEKDSQIYYYEKNALNDIVSIYSQIGEKLVEYSYDAWGNLVSVEGDTELGTINPFRYRSYYYDNESGLYYLINRYYDSKVKRFLNADQYISVQEENLLSYGKNNPLKYADSSGNAIETIIDVLSIGWSFASLVTSPSWANLGYLMWDVGAVFVPFVPGSYVAKGGKKLLKVASKTSEFKNAKYLTIGTYTKLKKLFKNCKNVEVHHIIEKRFRNTGKLKYKGKKISAGSMMSVPLEKSLHQKITKRWRKEIPYGTDYTKISKTRMRIAINRVYYDMPALKAYALKYLDEVWK